MASVKSPTAKAKDSARKKPARAGDEPVRATHIGARPTRTNDIRTAFLDFFAKNDHAVIPSSPLVPRHDPTLMFTNAGMVPFKNVFTGQEKPVALRAASSQKCVRAGGKHNDLDNVGYTARHHTFFEMLGNFSFGDYFKERAILLAWELLTKDFALDPKRLIVTVYADDEEAAKLWNKIAGIPDREILRIAGSDNFWSMGDMGPCGPCSEIFFDHGSAIAGGPPGSADEDGDRFVEIWNLVFMQYEQLADGTRVDLPHPSIDTGMGLERVAAVLQGTHDNYAIDLFRALIAASVDLTGVPARGEHSPSHRIIADHLRASSFLIADGVLPSNEGRGYVLRRIMRRAMRHAHILGAKDPLLYRLVPPLVAEMGHAYPELERGTSLIEETLKLEETRFRETLERGLKLLDDAVKGLKRGDTLPGAVAFKLYDTYGFPYDLTEDALKAKGIAVDAQGFAAAMERQREEARDRGRARAKRPPTSCGSSSRKSSARPSSSATRPRPRRARSWRSSRTAPASMRSAGERGIVILNQTPFYAESGGQVGDRGALSAKAHASRSRTRRRSCTASIFTSARSRAARSRSAIKSSSRSTMRDAPPRARITQRRICLHEALRARARRACGAEGLSGRARALALRLLAPKPMTHEEVRAVEALANANDPPEHAGRDASDDARGGDRERRTRFVRREIRRRGPRGQHGRR